MIIMRQPHKNQKLKLTMTQMIKKTKFNNPSKFKENNFKSMKDCLINGNKTVTLKCNGHRYLLRY